MLRGRVGGGERGGEERRSAWKGLIIPTDSREAMDESL